MVGYAAGYVPQVKPRSDPQKSENITGYRYMYVKCTQLKQKASCAGHHRHHVRLMAALRRRHAKVVEHQYTSTGRPAAHRHAYPARPDFDVLAGLARRSGRLHQH